MDHTAFLSVAVLDHDDHLLGFDHIGCGRLLHLQLVLVVQFILRVRPRVLRSVIGQSLISCMHIGCLKLLLARFWVDNLLAVQGAPAVLDREFVGGGDVAAGICGQRTLHFSEALLIQLGARADNSVLD